MSIGWDGLGMSSNGFRMDMCWACACARTWTGHVLDVVLAKLGLVLAEHGLG
jgi:hypothetical protein